MGKLGAGNILYNDAGSKITGVKHPDGTEEFFALSPVQGAKLVSVDVTVTAALLDSGGKVTVIPAGQGQWKIRGITLVGGGTNYAAGGDRNISLSDGTTTWTTIANADIESAPAASLPWGNAKVPMLTGTTDTASAANAEIKFAYSNGTTDHSATGSIKFNVLLEKVG